MPRPRAWPGRPHLTERLAVLAAGGTGGHLFPAQALGEVLIARGWRIVLATDERGKGLTEGFPCERRIATPAATLSGGPLNRARQVLAITRGILHARTALKALQPAVVVGFGGYPSLPALLAARSLRLPTVIHEQNAVMGRANRLLAGGVSALARAFPTLINAPPSVMARAVVVGNPVRPAIRALAATPYQAPASEAPLHLFVTGGSLGARVLSEQVPPAVAALPAALRQRLQVAQQTRSEFLEPAAATYRDAGVTAELAPFFSDMAERWAWSHLVISRAGASTVGEIAVAGRPAILVPLQIALDDDQGHNARLLAEAGAAVVVREPELTAARLAEVLAELLGDPDRLGRMAAAARSVATPDAAERLADLVERAAKR